MKNATESLIVGTQGTAETVVNEEQTAEYMGSGSLNVFATPAMLVLMEKAAINAVCGLLPDNYQSVGTRIELKHEGATPVGMRVKAIAELTSVKGRILTFHITVRDEKGIIGVGLHERTIYSLITFKRLLRQKMTRESSDLSELQPKKYA